MSTNTKCGLCNKDIDPQQSLWMDAGKYYLCLECDHKIKLRQAEANAKRQEKLNFDASVELDRSEIIFLRHNKILSVRGYIFLALRVDFSIEQTNHSMDIKDFCDRWHISQYDLISALSIFGKKGFIYLRSGKLELQILDKKHILGNLEKNLNTNYVSDIQQPN